MLAIHSSLNKNTQHYRYNVDILVLCGIGTDDIINEILETIICIDTAI